MNNDKFAKWMEEVNALLEQTLTLSEVLGRHANLLSEDVESAKQKKYPLAA